MPVTSLYAAIFGLLLVVLSVRTLRLRRQLRIGIGHGDDPRMERAMRVHANFCEYVPIALLLMYLFEQSVGGNYWAHGLGICLLTGRVLHAFGVSQAKEDYRFRVLGMVLTFIVIISASGRLLLAHAGWFSA